MMRIRQDQRHDDAGVVALLAESLGESPLTATIRPTLTWIAEDERGRLLGAAVVRLDEYDRWHLWYFGVLPEAQRQGVGSAILEVVESAAREAGVIALRTRTYTRWSAMRQLLVKRGWAFVNASLGSYHDGIEEEWVLPVRKKSLSVVLVGANPNGRGGELAEVVKELKPLVRLTGVCDTDPDVLSFWHDQVPTSRDLEELLGSVEAEAAILALPHSAYREARQICLRHRLGIFHEKPLACSLGELLELQDQLTRRPTPLVVGVQRRAHPSYVFLKRALQMDAPHSLEIRIALGKRPEACGDVPQKNDWRSNPRISGGGAILDIGYHAIDMVHFLTNAPLQTISCNLWVGDRPAAGDELETAATLFGRAGPTWVKVVIDRHGKKSERVAARGRQVWEADRATVSCDGEMRFSCPESWDLALRGQLVTLMIACSSPVSPVSLWDHLMGLRVVEQARGLSRIQGLADCGGQS